jgi:hypothetical protein
MANTLNLSDYLGKVPELMLDNYDAWQYKVKRVLQLAGVDNYLTLVVVADTPAADKAMSSMVLAFIKLSCSDIMGTRIMQTVNAAEASSFLAKFMILLHDDLAVQLRQLQDLPTEDCATYFDGAEVLYQKELRADMKVISVNMTSSGILWLDSVLSSL